ncbi:MAG: lipopolysaccharide transport system ATP-binding protein [Parvicella sp.]|jgi:lipopolysaccharide transport system ATP-binding protein
MSDVAISVEGISKKYLIGHQVATSLSDRVRSLMGKKMIGSEEEFWALKDVSFEIKKGEVVGIIGKNGAGKSTLLKILSRITYPTAGRFEMNGRVSSLLEVGTGFHPELSGRENIFLNGTILGMSRREVKEKFDEIVDFSGVSKFLDTPVKHYSSGMYVRLAFAVAAHLEPEILIIDEVLAVGDAEFQKRCLGKMNEVAKQGRTVIFVSHNMEAVSKLCTIGIVFKEGKVDTVTDIKTAVEKYIETDEKEIESYNSISSKECYLKKAFIQQDEKISSNHLPHDKNIELTLLINSSINLESVLLSLTMLDYLKSPVFTLHTDLKTYKTNSANELSLLFKISGGYIAPGKYTLSFILRGLYQDLDRMDDFLTFQVYDNGSRYYKWEEVNYGSIFAENFINITDETI